MDVFCVFGQPTCPASIFVRGASPPLNRAGEIDRLRRSLQAAACGGDMCGLSGILTAMLLLPLSLLSFLAAFVSTALANAILLLALFANTYWLRSIGKRLEQGGRARRIPPDA